MVCTSEVISFNADKAKTTPSEEQQPLLGITEEDVPSDNGWEAVYDLLSFSAPDTPLLLCAFAAGEHLL